jgi:hypothetical protein
VTLFQPGGFGPPPPVIPGNVYRFASSSWLGSGLDDDIHALAFHGGMLYAAGRMFYRSNDGGTTWTSTALPGSSTAAQIAVADTDPATIYVLSGFASQVQLLRSDDGGDSFQIVGPANLTAIAVNPFDSSLHAGTMASADAYVAEFGPDGTLLYSNFIGGPNSERGEGIAVDASGVPYIIAVTGTPVAGLSSNFTTPYQATAFVASGDGSYSTTLGPTTSFTVLDMPSHGITIGPDGSIIAVMIATTPGLPTTPDAAQSYLSGASDVYLVKWSRSSAPAPKHLRDEHQ